MSAAQGFSDHIDLFNNVCKLTGDFPVEVPGVPRELMGAAWPDARSDVERLDGEYPPGMLACASLAVRNWCQNALAAKLGVEVRFDISSV